MCDRTVHSRNKCRSAPDDIAVLPADGSRGWDGDASLGRSRFGRRSTCGRQKLPNICTGSQTWLLEHCSPGTCYGLEPTIRYCILSHRRPPSPCMVSGAGCGLTHAWSVSHRLACVSRRSLTWMHASAWRTIRFAQERNQTRALQDGLYGRPASGAEGTLGSWAERCVSVQCSSLAGSSPMRSRRR